jgi:predicted aldo/keto reductase-like oxidoreductase
VGSLLAPLSVQADAAGKPAALPTRPFGNSGVTVPILSMGGSLRLTQLMLRQAFTLGITYWDTANSYMGGHSEKQIGKYLKKYPRDRQALFLVTKSHAWTVKGMEADLHQSLERMQTDYVDLFFAHSVNDIDELDHARQVWAEKMKARGKIRLFGLSTHRNMAACMVGASTLGWIDAVMMSYNFRIMHSDEMRRAVDACTRAGIGLTAMKTQGGGSLETAPGTERELAGRMREKGFTAAQAKLKAVWENPQIASICSEMPNMRILMENTAAALDRTRLTAKDTDLFQRYAARTRSEYCTGCAHICESALAQAVPVCDIMRHLMYWHSYGNRRRASQYFDRFSTAQRMQMAGADYSQAERRCPAQMAIGRLVRSALCEFTA